MIFTYDALRKIIVDILLKIGCSSEHANISADVLMAAELRNINSHGVIRLKDYINLYEKGRLNPLPNIKITHQTPSTAVIDADAALGMVAGDFAMKIAIQKAKEVGTGWVAVNNSNHFGIAGHYAMRALKHDMIGITMTNANPLVAPTFSLDRLLGTNPIAVAIPAGKYPPFVADFATTPIARGKLDVMHKKGLEAPLGYVQDKTGMPSTNPNILTEGGAILPLGGDYEHGSHKGYCLGSVVDIFSALLSGAGFGPFVPPSVAYLPIKETGNGKGTGHFFGAMRIDAFQTTEDFKLKMDTWIETFKNAHSIDDEHKVLIPGEPEKEWEAIHMLQGITVMDKVVEELKQAAASLGVEIDF